MEIIIAQFEQWDGIYVDGVCEIEDHTLYACDVVTVLEKRLPCSIENIELRPVDENWWFERAEKGADGYPRNIGDVIFEKEIEDEN